MPASADRSIIVRLPERLHAALKERARVLNVSLNRLCLTLLSSPAKPERASKAVLVPQISSPSLTVALEELLAQAQRAFSEHLIGLVLFGSAARSTMTESSDIDVLVVLEDSVKIDRDIYSQWKLYSYGGREISPLIVNLPAEDEIRGIWLEVALDGVVLLDKNLRISRHLGAVRSYIANGNVRRMISQGHPYWVHQKKESTDTSGQSV